jgi:hypothetical protein
MAVVGGSGVGVVGALGVAPVVGLALQGGAVHGASAHGAMDEAGEQVAAGFCSRTTSLWESGTGDARVDAFPQFAVDEGGPGGGVGGDPGVGGLPALAAGGARCGVGRVDEFVVAALASDDLVAEVAGVGEDRPDGGAAPHAGRAWVSGRSDLAGAGQAVAFEDRGDAAIADAGVEQLEDSLYDRGSVGVGFEDAELDPGGGLLALRVRLVGVDEPVPVVGSPTEPTARGAVGEHRVAGADLEPAAFGFRQPAEQAHEHLVSFAVGVDPTAELGHPQFDPVVGELREHELELAAGERSLWLGDHQRRPPAPTVGGVAQ